MDELRSARYSRSYIAAISDDFRSCSRNRVTKTSGRGCANCWRMNRPVCGPVRGNDGGQATEPWQALLEIHHGPHPTAKSTRYGATSSFVPRA